MEWWLDHTIYHLARPVKSFWFSSTQSATIIRRWRFFSVELLKKVGVTWWKSKDCWKHHIENGTAAYSRLPSLRLWYYSLHKYDYVCHLRSPFRIFKFRCTFLNQLPQKYPIFVFDMSRSINTRRDPLHFELCTKK